jgi:hypothetical protein
MRERKRNAQTVAVGTRDREFGPAVFVEVVEAERAGGPTENLGPGYSPNPFSRRVEMTDAMILIQHHDSIVGTLECGQQDVGTFGRARTSRV